MNTKPDIIDRLNDDEMYVDAIDDAIAEIQRLRREVVRLNAQLAEMQWSYKAELE